MQTTGTEAALETLLAEMHRQTGAKMGVWFGCAMPSEFTAWRDEYAFARKSVALIDKNYRAYFSFTGPDRVRYLNAILTNNIRDLHSGEGTVSLLLNPQGHILAEIETYAQPDSLFCVSYAMIRTRLAEVLEKYIIMDDVTLSDETNKFGTLALEGPRASTVAREVSQVDVESLGELGFREGNARSIPCRISKRSPGGGSGAEFVVEQKNLTALWSTLKESVRRHGGGPMGYQALSALHLEQGTPWFGYDFGEEQIPHEAGLQESHISYVKGCYTGQEIVERVRSRGHANRVRVGLKFSASASVEHRAPLSVGRKDIGFVTRTAFSPALEKVIGMGYVRREHSAPGTILDCSSGKAEVIQFPIAA